MVWRRIVVWLFAPTLGSVTAGTAIYGAASTSVPLISCTIAGLGATAADAGAPLNVLICTV